MSSSVMTGVMTGVMMAAAIGIGATAVMDGWSVVQRRALGVPPLNYRFVGRWIGHFPRQRFVHASIQNADPIAGEAFTGWIAHYAIGIAWAGLLLGVWGLDWVREPTLFPALAVGIGSVAAPSFVMQPAFGIGVAASKLPKPWSARLFSLLAHTSFALGLYLSAVVLSSIAMSGGEP
jgi:hypothetical protein